jgi:hypothetical protein
MKSIMQNEKSCYVCGIKGSGLHEHHCIPGSANRKKSEKYGLKITLCPKHHNMSNAGVHFNRVLDIKVRQAAQRKFEETHTRAEWMKEFGKNYIDD